MFKRLFRKKRPAEPARIWEAVEELRAAHAETRKTTEHSERVRQKLERAIAEEQRFDQLFHAMLPRDKDADGS